MNLSGLRMRKKIHDFLCLSVVVVIIVAGLWPFNFWPVNKARWLKDQNGIQFFGQAIIYSTISFFQSSSLPPTPSTLHPFSIEIWLQPEKESYDYTACILAFHTNQGFTNLSMGEWKSHLILQNRIGETYQKIGLRDVFKNGVKRFFTITSGPEGTKVYIDGKLKGNYPKFNLFLGNEGNIGQLIFGNSPTGKQYWTGNLLGLAIYNKSLTEEQILKSFEEWEKNKKSPLKKEEGLVSSYLFDERSGTLAHDHVGSRHLLIPSTFKVLQKTILVPPWKDFSLSRSYFMDILTNILGFIPFGFFFSAYLWLRKPHSTYRILFISLLLAGCISLSIELIQVYLPTRSSQLTDVITNIFGSFLGGILFHLYYPKRHLPS
jgi:VanZ family protein